MPPCASGPVFTVRRPSLNGAACAIAGAGKLNVAAAAPAAVPAMNLRRVTLRDIEIPPFDWAGRPYFGDLALLVAMVRLSAIRHASAHGTQVAPIIRKAFHEVKPARASTPCQSVPRPGWAANVAETVLDPEIVGFDLVVGAQFFRLGRIDHLAFAHHMHVIDKLEREVGVLLHQQDG